jgi:hypothetical protein
VDCLEIYSVLVQVFLKAMSLGDVAVSMATSTIKIDLCAEYVIKVYCFLLIRRACWV